MTEKSEAKILPIKDKPNITKKKDVYIFDYPQAAEFARTQNEIFWLADEIEVEKDLHDLKTNFTDAEYHGVISTLKLFTLYELVVGNEYWGGRVKRMFPRPEIEMMASCFSYFELNVHAPFYDKINKLLGLSNDSFYTAYLEDPVLKDRMDWIDKQVSQKCNLKSLGSFAIVEGAILFSAFAFLKHFQAEGKNKLVNITAGINFSIRDENLHSQGGSWLFRTLLEESNLTTEERSELQEYFHAVVKEILEHECRIIDMIFDKGPIKGITDKQLKNFVESRLDVCLEYLGFEKLFKPTYNPIAKWFYKNINTSHFHDFFAKLGNSYNRNWTEKSFVWRLPEND